MRILVQFIGQAAGLLILSKRKGRNFFKWKMFLFPVPVILAMLIWLGIFFSTGKEMILAGLTVIGAGLIAYFIKAKYNGEWPFEK
jgi:hypothetical protein